MPIIACLKEPQINLVLDGEIKDESSAEFDALFPNLMIKDQDGHNVVIPLSRDCSIAFLKEVTQEEIDEQKAQMEKRKAARERAASMGGGGSSFIKPDFLFPSGKKGRG